MCAAGRLVAAVPRARLGIAALVAVLLAITATGVGQGLVVARVLARVVSGDPVGSVVPLLVLAGALQVVRSALLLGRHDLSARVAGAVGADVRRRLARRLLVLGPAGGQERRTGNVQSTVVDGVESLGPYAGLFVPQAIAAVAGALATTAVVVAIDPAIGLVILSCAALAPVVPRLSRRVLRSRYVPWWHAYRRLYADNLDAIQGMATLKALNASRRRAAELRDQAEEFCRYSMRLNSVVLAYVGIVALLVGGGSAAAVGLGALHRASGDLSTTELFTILLLSRECFRPVRDLQDAYHASYPAAPAALAITDLLGGEQADREQAEPDAERGPGPRPERGRHRAEPPAVVFEDVTFTYPGRVAPAVEGVTFRVEAGETVAVVGRSGAGKTTLTSLLLRFVTPDRGRVLVGDQDITDLPAAEVRRLVAVVAQDTYLFHGSMRRNLMLARPEATEAEVADALRAARAGGIVAGLPGGYDAAVGERGLTLSGGERQRIAIARALLKDAPVLVLDEATSSLDGANEAEIQGALDGLARGRTTLVIAHRLSTVARADRVVVLDAGRVVEAGTHAELLDRRGDYSRMVAAQRQAGRAGPADRASTVGGRR